MKHFPYCVLLLALPFSSHAFFEIGNIGPSALAWNSFGFSASTVTNGATATVFQTPTTSVQVPVDVTRWTISDPNNSNTPFLQLDAYLETVNFDWTVEVTSPSTGYPTQPTPGYHPGTLTAGFDKTILPAVRWADSTTTDGVQVPISSGVVSNNATPRLFLGRATNDAAGVVGQFSVANGPSPGPLNSGSVAYSVRIVLTPLNSYTLNSVYTAGHGTGNPERLTLPTTRPELTRLNGTVVGSDGNQTADLDGFQETGEFGRLDGTDGTIVAFINEVATQLNPITFTYDTVARDGTYQTFTISQIGATVPEPGSFGLLAALPALAVLRRRANR